LERTREQRLRWTKEPVDDLDQLAIYCVGDAARRSTETLEVMGSADETDRLVEVAALELVHRDNLSEIETVLCSKGANSSDAKRLVLLVPSAFAREYFEPDGIEFPNYYLAGPEGHDQELPYDSEPIYLSARRLAQRWLAESRPSLVKRVLDWSAEASGIKQARERGLTPSRVSVVRHDIGQ
jgi:hypothetical protein